MSRRAVGRNIPSKRPRCRIRYSIGGVACRRSEPSEKEREKGPEPSRLGAFFLSGVGFVLVRGRWAHAMRPYSAEWFCSVGAHCVRPDLWGCRFPYSFEKGGKARENGTPAIFPGAAGGRGCPIRYSFRSIFRAIQAGFSGRDGSFLVAIRKNNRNTVFFRLASSMHKDAALP